LILEKCEIRKCIASLDCARDVRCPTTMSGFEDNNPFAAERRFSNSSAGSGGTQDQSNHSEPQTPYPQDDSTEDAGEGVPNRPSSFQQKKTYNTRVENYLLENPSSVHLQIIDAGKSNEGNGSYIVYNIRTGDVNVKRRYSEFESLRNNLVKLFPVLVVPCIPEKHSMADYAAAPTKAKEDMQILDHRKRMLTVFLNRCVKIKEVRESSVFQRFLDPAASWSEVLNSPPVSTLPKNILKAPPLNPSSPSPEHQHLPIPSSSSKLHEPEEEVYGDADSEAKEYETIANGLEKINRRIIKRLAEMATDHSELGARYNAFSLSESGSLAAVIERIGQAMDSTYLATEELVGSLSSGFAEPVAESSQLAQMVRTVLKYRKQKSLQMDMTVDQLAKNRTSLDGLERSESEARRIETYLQGNVQRPPVEAPTATEERFPPTHEEGAVQKKSNPGGFKMFGKLNHAIHGIIDVDPETTRRNNIGKTRETISQVRAGRV